MSVQNISAGISSSGPSPMQAIGLAANLLGNVNKNDSSTTQSAVSGNINLTVRDGETPTALSRDTENANQSVKVFDKEEYKERAEMAQVIGEISKNAVSMATYEDRQESSKLKDQAKDAENANDETKAKALYAQAADIDKRIDDTFGIGSTNGQAIAAVTAVLQGLAGDNIGQAVAGGLSPYVNAKIKELTKDNDEANIAAHALWGAIEAQAGGNNALAGATAAASGEMAAKLLTQQIYGKEPQDLTASEKETISSLSQVVGALSSVAVANNSNDAYRGAEVAKSAVENNQFGMDVAGNLGVILAREQENCDDECKTNLDAFLMRSNEIMLNANTAVLGAATVAYAPAIMTGSSIISGAIGTGVEFSSQYIAVNGDLSKIDYIDIGSSGLTGIITKDMGFRGIVLTNMGSQALNSYRKGEDVLSNTLASGGTALLGALAGKGFEKGMDTVINKNFKLYEPITSNIYPAVSKFPEKSIIPATLGNVADSIFSKSVEKPINYYINKGVNNIKDNGALHEK